jgi:hypothetical protein
MLPGLPMPTRPPTARIVGRNTTYNSILTKLLPPCLQTADQEYGHTLQHLLKCHFVDRLRKRLELKPMCIRIVIVHDNQIELVTI